MFAVDDVVDTLRLIVNRNVGGIVISKSHARHDIDAVSFVPADCNGSHVSNRQSVKGTLVRAFECSGGHLRQVITLARLVVEGSDPADSVGAEGVLSCCVSISSRIALFGLDHTNVESLAVRLAHNLV